MLFYCISVLLAATVHSSESTNKAVANGDEGLPNLGLSRSGCFYRGNTSTSHLPPESNEPDSPPFGTRIPGVTSTLSVDSGEGAAVPAAQTDSQPMRKAP